MYRKQFVIGSLGAAFLWWALTGYYPFDISPYERTASAFGIAAAMVQIIALFVCGLGGLIASIMCFYTFAEIATPDAERNRSATAELQESRMAAVPYVSTLALAWLGMWAVQIAQVSWMRGGAALLFGGLFALILAGVFLVVAEGVYRMLFPARRAVSQRA